MKTIEPGAFSPEFDDETERLVDEALGGDTGRLSDASASETDVQDREQASAREPGSEAPPVLSGETQNADGEHHHHSDSGEHHRHSDSGEHHRHHSDGSKHHHHHHHHHRRSSGRRRRSPEQIRKLTIVAGLLVVLLLVVVLLSTREEDPEEAEEATNESTYVGTTGIALHPFSEPVSLTSKAVEDYMADEKGKPISDFVADATEEEQRADVGGNVRIEFSVSGQYAPSGRSSIIELSESPDFSSEKLYVIGNESFLSIPYLNAGTQYYYRITTTLPDGSTVSANSSFETKDLPRILTVDGLRNVRDIGGWKTASGKTLRQGLLIRGSEPDQQNVSRNQITEKGIGELLGLLGVRTELDLRTGGEARLTTRMLGDLVSYYQLPVFETGISAASSDNLCRIFALLAEPENYPIYLHCTDGVEKTGRFCAVLEALLGMEREDILREYELSGLVDELSTEGIENELSMLASIASGATLAEKTEAFLLRCGVTAEQIAAVRSIFLTDKN